MQAARKSLSYGFVMNPSAPDWSAPITSPESERAVSRITGAPRSSASALIRRQSSKPSSRGMTTSVMTTFGLVLAGERVRFLSVARGHHLAAAFQERRLEQPAADRIVVHHEHFHWAASSSRAASAREKRSISFSSTA